MSAFQDAPKPHIMRFIKGFTNFSVDPYYDPLSLVMINAYKSFYKDHRVAIIFELQKKEELHTYESRQRINVVDELLQSAVVGRLSQRAIQLLSSQ